MKKLIQVIGASLAIVAFAAPAAFAASYAGGRTGSYASGTVTITPSNTTLSGTVKDTVADGYSAHLKGNWDFPLAPDISFNVATASGNGTSKYGSKSTVTYGGARDFEVRVCTGSACVVVWEGDYNDM